MCACSVMYNSSRVHELQLSRLLCPWNFPGKNTVGYQFLLQELFPTQGLNPRLLHLLHWQVDSLPLAPPGKPHKICIMYMYFPIENCLDYVQHIPSSFQCLWNYGLREVTTSNESEYIVDLTEAQLMSPHFDSHTNYYYFCQGYSCCCSQCCSRTLYSVLKHLI